MLTKRGFLKLAAVPLCSCCLGIPLQALAQNRIKMRAKHGCSYDGRPGKDEPIYGFQSSGEAIAFVETITRKVGLPSNFVTMAGNVSNASAVMSEDGTQRLVVYSEVFMASVLKSTKTDWAGLSILAHEVGHHLSGHTLDGDGSRPMKELEADSFSGFVVRLMGGSLDDASIAIRTLVGDEGSSTHPPKSARLEAIASGWNRAGGAENRKEPAGKMQPASGGGTEDPDEQLLR
ncbi:MAG: hypothetical protein HQL34_03215 [Alphaproteobacteria bacterium]|nr:hypothetical protein [Alphaproteobacteria bacterium]